MPVAISEKYECYTPAAIAKLRDQGAAGEQHAAILRRDWLSRGSPAIRADASSVPPVASFDVELPADYPVYEEYTPGALAELRASGPAGEATYIGMRSSWEDRGSPAIRADASSVAPAVHPFAEAHVAALVGDRVYEDHTPLEMAALREEQPDAYRALRRDWESRGKPAVKTA